MWSFKAYGYGHKQASIHTHVQCSLTSVGLAQSHPNKHEEETFENITPKPPSLFKQKGGEKITYDCDIVW